MKHTQIRNFKAIMVATFSWVTMAFLSCDKEGYGPYPSPVVSRIQFAGSQLEIGEDQQEIIIGVLISPKAKENGSITLNVANNQVVYGDDYHTNPTVTDGKIIIPVQAGAEKVFVTLSPVNNELTNLQRSITLTMAQPENSTLKPEGKTTTTVKLLDDETQVNIGFEYEQAYVSENNANGYMVKLPISPAATKNGFVELAFTTIQAQYGKDFNIFPEPVEGKLRLPVAQHAPFVSFVVIPQDDFVLSKNRSILFSIVDASPFLIPSGKTNFTLHISDKGMHNRLSVQRIRDSYKGEVLYYMAPVRVEGVVISSTDNIGRNMLFLQDETGGIALLFNGPHNVQTGEKISVNLEGGALEELNQALTLTNIPTEQIEKTGFDLHSVPEITLGQLYEKPEALEGQIITLKGVRFPAANGSTTLEGVHFIQGNNREARVLVNSFASFKNQIIPGGTVSVKGILVWNDAGYYTILPQRAGDIK